MVPQVLMLSDWCLPEVRDPKLEFSLASHPILVWHKMLGRLSPSTFNQNVD
jgi:hypothetical protein